LLVDALRTSQNDLDRAVARLGDVESDVVEGAARIEALERRVEGMRDRIEGARTRAEEDVSAGLASFRKFEETFWEKERRLEAVLGH
jgi:capsule polysaccharide export protein KpsE/RkpR